MLTHIIIAVPIIRLPENKLVALDKSPPSLYAHVAPEYGEGVMGFLDVFHQLHCLVCWNPRVQLPG
jgi:Mycotoxin biosynthesis protein UstYa